MSSRTTCWLIFGVLLCATFAVGDTPGYQKGTLTKDSSSARKSYDLKDGGKGYQISNCGDFQDGQVVDYRVKDDKIYIRRDDGKEYKCSIVATMEPTAADVATPATYQKGTIGGYEIRKDTTVHGGGANSQVSSYTRNAKVYELHGPDLIYKVDYCGSFQAGQFDPGQVVEFRVGNGDDTGRLFIRHDGNKEYSCKLEGTKKPDDVSPTAAGATTPSNASSVSSAASTAKLSISSAPDGADIEVDGNFSGNTPSDLEVPEGEHTIAVKKSGYKDWQRTMKVAAGSSVHLNAELEKTTN